MNERVAKVGEQVKNAFTKVKITWTEQDPARRKKILIIVLGLIAFAIGLAIVLNMISGRYVVLYEGMSADDTTAAISALETAGIPSRRNSNGELEVPSKEANRAMAQLALQGLPSTTLDYNVFAQSSGMTTTEFEKKTALHHQWQNRLQDIIREYDGVQNAAVTLNINDSSSRVWDTTATKNSGSVSLTMKPGYVMAPSQVNAIRYMVGSSVGIAPEDVVVVDSGGNLLAASGETYDAEAAVTATVLERIGLQETVESRLGNKAANLLSLQYPDQSKFRISCLVELDFDEVVTEIKEYTPLDGTIHGVVSYEEVQAVMGLGQYAEGVVGETDNTDVPIYVDYNGDGIADSVDYLRMREYAVGYVLKQITQDGPKQTSATMSVAIDDGTLDDTDIQQLRLMISNGTGIPLENVSVHSTPITAITGPGDEPSPGLIFGIPMLYLYIAAGALLLLILVLVFVLVLRGKSRKKKLLAERAAEIAEQEEAERVQQEIEERKRQLKNAAIGDQSENAITNEVREFARNNPEITANLLRNWLKEGE